MPANATADDIKRAFRQSGGPALRNVRKMLIQKYRDESYPSQALRYLSKVTLHNALPVFPALVSMANEAVGGKVEDTIPFGEGLLLISFAADLHDDVIDQSFAKGPKQTVLGKFNLPTAILAGDILLVEGLKQLAEAAELLSGDKSQEILRWVSEAVFEICSAEALQLTLKNKICVAPEEYHEVIRLKAVVPELCMKIGAFLGTNNKDDIKGIGNFGRIYGINSTIVEEFADLLTKDELKNRLKNECPPLPMLYALQNPELRDKLQNMINSGVTEADAEKIADMVLNTMEVEDLKEVLVSNAVKGQRELPKTVKGKTREELENLLFVPLKYFET